MKWRASVLRMSAFEDSLRLKSAIGREVFGQPTRYRPAGVTVVGHAWTILRRSGRARRWEWSNQALAALDPDVSARQGFGSGFDTRANDADLARGVINGSVVLSPHPEWEIPADLSWTEDPFGQDNWRFQLHTLRWIDPLRRVATEGGVLAPDAATRWWELANSWIEHCLFADNAVAWKDMAVGTRTIALVAGYSLVPEAERPRFLTCVRMHVEHLANPRNHARGNHLLHQLQGLFVAAHFLGDRRMVEQALGHIEVLFRESYDAEGINAEGALGYHDMNFQWWRQMEQRLDVEGENPTWLHDTLVRAREAIVHGVRPDGVLETIGDTAVGKNLSTDDLPVSEFVRTAGASGARPSEVAASFSAGYGFGRSGWGSEQRPFGEETFYSVRFGEDKSMHGHRDSTSFTVFARGVAWIVDPGMYGYGASEMRSFMCARPAHNVVLDLRRPNYPNKGARLVSSHLGPEVDTYVMDSAPSPAITTRRLFAYHREADVFVVDDSVSDLGAGVLGHVRQLWHLGMGVEVVDGGDFDSVVLRSGDRTAYVSWAGCRERNEHRGDEEPLQGWVTSAYGEVQPAAVLSVVPPQGARTARVTAVISFDHPCTGIEVEGEVGRGVVTARFGERVVSVGDNDQVTADGRRTTGAP